MNEHLVDLYLDRCSGCTRCMRVCPTEALRIKDRKVFLKHDHCIYCGNCITSCHKSAFKVTSDSFASLNKYKVNVAILPLAMYGMISCHRDHQLIYKTLMDFGFDEVFDLSIVTHLISEKIDYILEHEVDRPLILTQCPTVIRMIQKNYPTLMEQLLPIDFPYEIGAKMAKKKVMEKYNLKEEEIGISYISECLSNYAAIKEPLGKATSQIDHVFLFQDIFKSLVDQFSSDDVVNIDVNASKKGMLYAKEGAIHQSTSIKEYISVDGINDVSDIFEKVYLNTIPKVKVIEAYSCVGGCIGGNFTLENSFIAKWKINHYHNHLTSEASELYVKSYRTYLADQEWYFSEEIGLPHDQNYKKNMLESIKRMNKINQILLKLPKIDCCACGSPTCRALAEDIVSGEKSIQDCVVLRNAGY